MNKAFAIIVGLLLLVMLVLFSTTYTVRFNEVAVRTTFGSTSSASVNQQPGLHFRYPLFADRVTKYDTRLQLVETPLVEVPTADGQSIVVRAFLLWRVEREPQRVLAFARSYPALRDADLDLKGQLQTALKAGLSRHTFNELIGPGGRLAATEHEVLEQLASSVAPQGITPRFVGISQVKLPAKTTTAVLARMQATRRKLAETERSKGNSDAAAIRYQAKTLVDKMRAFANQRVEEIKDHANQRAAEYLRMMSEDPQFAIFLLRLDALRSTLKDTSTFFFSDSASPWYLLNFGNMTGADPIPKPPGEAEAPVEKRARGESAPQQGPGQGGGS